MASILAKVERDNYMKNLPKKLEVYKFENHKWYATKLHFEKILKYWISSIHRKRFLINFTNKLKTKPNKTQIEKQIIEDINNFKNSFTESILNINKSSNQTLLPTKKFNWPIIVIQNSFKFSSNFSLNKPKLLLHVCCAPDLAWPLRILKKYFKIYLFWYNPNIHPLSEHKKRYEQYVKLTWLEKWDYEILEGRYDPKEFFDYLYKRKSEEDLKKSKEDKTKLSINNTLWKEFALMEEKNSPRCWWCYDLRLEKTAQIAVKHWIEYFSTTLLISPKKDLSHLYQAWKRAEKLIWWKSKFLFFDFKKWWGFEKAAQICKDWGIRRQNYCWCVWSKRK